MPVLVVHAERMASSIVKGAAVVDNGSDATRKAMNRCRRGLSTGEGVGKSAVLLTCAQSRVTKKRFNQSCFPVAVPVCAVKRHLWESFALDVALTGMTIDRIIFAVAGTLVLLGLTLGLAVSSWFFIVTGFVGVNLLQSAFTGFCPLAVILRKAGMPESSCFRRASQE